MSTSLEPIGYFGVHTHCRNYRPRPSSELDGVDTTRTKTALYTRIITCAGETGRFTVGSCRRWNCFCCAYFSIRLNTDCNHYRWKEERIYGGFALHLYHMRAALWFTSLDTVLAALAWQIIAYSAWHGIAQHGLST